MKRVISTMTLLLCLASFSYAQYDVLDFESAAGGTGFTWTVDQNNTNPALTFPANPVSSGINTSATVAQFTALQTGEQWALTYTNDIDPFQFDATNTTIKIMVYKTEISDIGIKFEGTSAAKEVLVANTLTNQWEEITFDFSSVVGNIYDKIVIIPDFHARSQDNIVYFDNIQIPTGNYTVSEPTVAAPTPTHTVIGDGVISIYSDTYTDITGVNFAPSWGQATAKSDVVIAGNNTMKYTNLNYQGTDWNGNPQDLSDNGGLPAPGYTYYLHLDYWVFPSETATIVTIISGTWPNKKEHLIDFASFALEVWGSVDISLSDFYNGNNDMDLTDVKQLKVEAGGNGTMWIDNIYFYKSTAVAVPVELTYFNAKAENNQTNVLAWQTASELNNSHFEVERSLNGVDFEVIGLVEGNGTTVEVMNYTFVDENPITNTYYRLRQIDFDGQLEYSEIVNVNRRQVGSNDVKLYPNPVHNNLTIKYKSSIDEDVLITVTDITGRVLVTKNKTVAQGDNQLNVDLAQLPQGNYFVKLQSNTNTTIQTIVKE